MQLNETGRPLRSALPLLLAATCSTDAETFPLDHRVKASYLFNLLRFIEWPYDGGYPDGRFNFCIYGTDSLDAFYALDGERIRDRTICVARISDLAASRPSKCHLLFISADKPLASVPIARGLLTVGESEGFTARGGIVNLLLINGRIRFELNEELAQACDFSVDARLAKLGMPSRFAAQVG
jgi:uncharacterized protein DUF4154